MKKKMLFGGVGVVVVAVLIFVLFVRGANRKYDFRFDKVSKGDLTVYVTATGTISAVTTVDVGTQVSGIVSKLYADFNSVVKEGQVIAQIDPTFLEQAVKDGEANLSRANAQYADSKRTYDRTKSLFDKQLESQATFDAALTTLESNSAALKQAQATLDRAKINLAYATIYAPISGVVINRAVNVGQTVAASFSSPTLFTIANDLSKMQVQTTVDESDIGRISIGQEATFTVDAYSDEKFSGTVSQIRLAPVSIQNVVNYTVIIDVDNQQLKLMPGMTANVKILAASGKDILRVPNMALRLQPPADIVDSTKVQAMREGFMARADNGGTPDSARHMAPSGTDPTRDRSSGDRVEGRQASGGMPGGREYFEKLRDSIQAAHGGTLSREELRNKIASVMGSRWGSRADKQVKPTPAPVRRNVGSTKFGITIRYPEFQKSGYVPSHTSGRARIWVLGSTGKLEPIMVTTGMTDGRYTEITTDQLKPGDQIVLGVISNDAAAEQARSPLTQQGQRMGGPGFR